MAQINLLDKSVAELIAAGEVIERPASVVKELVENSIDAGANKIKIEIKDGGVTYIKISDNGSGIDKNDIKKAFLRHATSKIKNADDLDRIFTLGFRGEALASISAVAKITLITKTKDDIDGSIYFLNGEKDGVLEDFAATVGTTIIVEDLFFNVPARMKFLKKDSTEGNAVFSIVEKLALSHPEISFTLIKDGQEKLSTFGDNNLLSTIRCVLGKEFSSKLLPLEYEENHITITGFISNPSDVKRSRSFQNFFVNGRYVKSKTCMVALEEAYRSFIAQGLFPGCVLNINIPSNVIDINVHPAKLEIRFADEKKIYSLVYSAVKNCILSHSQNPIMPLKQNPNKLSSLSEKLDHMVSTSLVPESLTNDADKNDNMFFSATKPKLSHDPVIKGSSNYITNTDLKNIATSAADAYDKLKIKEGSPTFEYSKINSSHPNHFDKENLVETYETKEKEPEDKSFDIDQASDKTVSKEPVNNSNLESYGFLPSEEKNNFIGEVFNSFIILEKNKSIVFIDKHAAHERLIYEKIKNGDIKNNRQILLSPEILNLSLNEYAAAIDNINLFDNIGISVEDFGNKSIIIREIPTILTDCNISDFMSDIINNILNNKNNITPHILDRIYFSIACKAAIKAGDKNNNLELINLVKLLEQNQDLKNCPHGRPISFEINKKDIEKQFLR